MPLSPAQKEGLRRIARNSLQPSRGGRSQRKRNTEYLYDDDRNEAIICDPATRSAHGNVKVDLSGYPEAQMVLALETLSLMAH